MPHGFFGVQGWLPIPRPCGFYLASLMARVRTSSTVRRDNGPTDQSNDIRNAIFCVSASFSPDSVSSFSRSSYNPYGLAHWPRICGWMDSGDTRSVYHRKLRHSFHPMHPRIVAVDYAGSIPAAVNSSINGALIKSILAVETYMKSISPLPITRMPAPGLVLIEKKQDEPFAITSWKLRRRDDNHIMVMSTYKPDARLYHNTLLLSISSSAPRSPTLKPEDATPTSGRLLLSPPQGASLLEMQTGVTASPSTSLSVSPIRHRAASSSSDHSSSRERLRSSSSAFTLKGEVRQSTDLLVTEIVVDSKLYPDGYDIRLQSRIREDARHIPFKPADDPEGNKVLPIAYAVFTMPASPLHSSGLHADRSLSPSNSAFVAYGTVSDING